MWTVGLWPLSGVLRGRRGGKIRSPVRRNLGYYFRRTTEREKVSTFVSLRSQSSAMPGVECTA